MRTAVFFSNPFGFGPTGKMIAVLEEFKKYWDGQIVYASNGLCREIMHISDIIQKDVDQRDELSVERILRAYDRPVVISSLNRFAIAAAHRLKIPNAFIDGLAWLWDPIPEAFLRADMYICTKFPGLETKIKPYRNAYIVPFILSPLPDKSTKAGSILIHFGGGENPLQSEISQEYYALIGKALQKITWRGNITVAGGTGCIRIIAEHAHRDDIMFKTFTKDLFLQKLAEAGHFITTSGINATMEAFAIGVPTSFMLPSNLSQWKLLSHLIAFGAADSCLQWETYFPEYHIKVGISEKENIEDIHVLAQRMYKDQTIGQRFIEDVSKLVSQVPVTPWQQAFAEMLGTNGAEKTVAILRKNWNF